ncbi:Uncharacterized [Syntrophomonas zehnderi OL-4]|uniref:Uncharacterized n=1 Tax=Syntrophomonas zehnderi OL-4 TaxID=690567 RepID=A0A0E4C7Y5_9FIRM|nr:hypothetical protein [Syntrophomonas zehnderi]CFX15862.1 Uncharacterized [Syntrophomonas zehnderi OL-4]
MRIGITGSYGVELWPGKEISPGAKLGQMLKISYKGETSMEIKLNTEELEIAQEAIKSRAEVLGISPEQAAKDLLVIGINNWWAMEDMRRREEARRLEDFNPFAAARGEYRKLDAALNVRDQALKTGEDASQAVQAFLEGLRDLELDATLVEVEGHTARRLMPRLHKIELLANRICQQND